MKKKINIFLAILGLISVTSISTPFLVSCKSDDIKNKGDSMSNIKRYFKIKKVNGNVEILNYKPEDPTKIPLATQQAKFDGDLEEFKKENKEFGSSYQEWEPELYDKINSLKEGDIVYFEEPHIVVIYNY